MRSAVLITAALFALPAGAECPTAADLDTGIRFEIDGGEWEIYRRLQPGVVESRYYFNANEALRNVLAKGLYLTEVVDLQNDLPVAGTRSVYTYPVTPDQMPDPTPGGSWNTGATVLSSDGLSIEAQTYSFGEFVTHQIGACSYQMMPIEVRYSIQEEESDTVDFIHWLPDLGLSYLAGGQSGDSVDTYTYIAISVVK